MASEQKIVPLNAENVARLAKQRAVIESMIHGIPAMMAKYETPQGKVDILGAILKQNIFKPTETYQLQCMGIVFGDALASETGLEWYMVEDQFGSDPILTFPGTTLIVGALTMISKRVEQHPESAPIGKDLPALYKAQLQWIGDIKKRIGHI